MEISGISGGAMTALAIRQEHQVRVASLAKDVLELEGQMAGKLIAAAASVADTGQRLDLIV
jgi:surface antigen